MVNKNFWGSIKRMEPENFVPDQLPQNTPLKGLASFRYIRWRQNTEPSQLIAKVLRKNNLVESTADSGRP
jgi:hypothetical protein